jgi:hypothetical protein
LTLSGTYTGSAQGAYKITTYSSGFGQKFQTSGLEAYEGDIKNAPVPFGSKGLYIQFSGTISNGDTWTVNIPKPQAIEKMPELFLLPLRTCRRISFESRIPN